MKKDVDATLPTHANPDDVILFYILNLSSAAKVKFYFFYVFLYKLLCKMALLVRSLNKLC